MSSVSFSGLATGLDTGSIVAQLVDLKRAPIRRLEARRQLFADQQKALDTFKTKLLALQEAANKLDTANEFSSLKTSSADEDIVTVSADSDAAAGTYDINVTSLAVAQKDISQGFDTLSDDVGSGTMSFTVGDETTDLTFVGSTSIESLAETINNDVAGVSASIVFDGSDTGGYSLILSGSEPGTDNAFTVDMSGMSGGTTPVLTTEQAAVDAVFSIDGIDITASSNNPTDVISGLTINLVGASSGTETTTIKVETDAEGISESVSGMVDAYNDLFAYVTEHSGSGGTLRGNPAMSAVASRIESLFSSSLDDGYGDITLFSEVGVMRGSGRQLKFDADDFKTAIGDDFNGVRDFFIERDDNLGKTYLIDQAIEDMTDSIDGLFKISKDSLNSKIKYADSGIERYERSVESYRLTLTRKFTAMEQMVAQLNAQGSSLSTIQY